jgi:UDP-glucuronate 4-epimerase
MKVLVTGAAGFIGSHVCERLLADGNEVVGLDAFTAYYARDRKEQNLRHLLLSSRFQFIEADLRTDELAPILEGVQCVVHEAAMPGLPLSWSDIDGYATCNVVATARVLDASVKARVERFVHVSTSSVYGRIAVGDETAPLEPVSPYGITKLAGEHLAMAYMGAYGLPVVVLRYFSVFGPRQRPDMAYHIFIERLRRGEPITVFGDGTQTRSNTFIDDCVNGTVLAMAHGEPGEAYNLGGAEALSLREAIEIIAGQLGIRPTIEFAPRRIGDQVDTAADCRKAERAFGYRPDTDLTEGLAAQVRWHLEHVPL